MHWQSNCRHGASSLKTRTSADIVVVGAGVMGASIAYQLQKQSGRRIIVVDQFPPLGGMSGRTFGQVRLHYSNSLLLEMASRGYHYFQNWGAQAGYGDAGYHKPGYLLIVVEPQLEALRRDVTLAKALGIDTKFVDPDEIEAPAVVNAAGSWATRLLAPLGLEAPIEARRLDTMYLQQPPASIQTGRCITDGNSNVAIRPDMGRNILAGAYPKEMPLATDPGEPANPRADEEHMVRIRASLSERLPDFADAKPVRSVSGTYDITPDWHPILGWVPGIEGLYLTAGFSGHGLKLAPAVGETVAAAVLEQQAPFNVSPLRLERFAEGDLMFLAYGPGGRA